MQFKNNKCPNCGANITYDEKLHQHKCIYCNSIFVDKDREKKADPRVELTPDDLKRVSIGSGVNSNVTKGAAVAIIIITVITFFGFVFGMIAFFNAF